MKELMVIVLIFVALVQCSAIKSEQSHHHHGKEKDGHHHMGFVGSRGKRSINTLEDPSMMEASQPSDNFNAHEEGNEWPVLTQTLYDFQRSIRAPKGFFGMRGKKDFTNAEKRALMGIQQNLNGLRGRTRFMEEQNIDETLMEPQQSANSNQAYFGERAGEGKQYVSDYGNGNRLGEKRAPKGFFGMRGKKRDDEPNGDDFENNFYAQKRVPSRFTGVRGKKDSSMLQ